MAALRTMEDFLRQRMGVDRYTRVAVLTRSDGRFEASVVHADGRTATVEVDADPATALWNALAPFTLRRRLPSGREVVEAGAPEIEDLLADDDEIEDLLA